MLNRTLYGCEVLGIYLVVSHYCSNNASCVRYWFKSPVVWLPEDILVGQAPWASDIFALRAEMPRLPGQEPSTPIRSFRFYGLLYSTQQKAFPRLLVCRLRVFRTSLERVIAPPLRVTVHGCPSLWLSNVRFPHRLPTAEPCRTIFFFSDDMLRQSISA